MVDRIQDYFLNNHNKRESNTPKYILDTSLFTADRLQSLWEFKMSQKNISQSGVCAYQFKSREPAYRCKTCQTDSTCIQCIPCFKKSKHNGHEVMMVTTLEGGCCDCGDIESWKREGFCSDHQGLDSQSTQKGFSLTRKEQREANVLIDWVVNLITDAFGRKNNVFLFIDEDFDFDNLENETNRETQKVKTDKEKLFEKRYFDSDRDGFTSFGNNFLVYVHNNESVSYTIAKDSIRRTMGWSTTRVSPFVRLVDWDDFCALFGGTLERCREISESLERNKLPTTILPAPVSIFVVSKNDLVSMLDWILTMCQRSPVFQKMVIKALSKPLTVLQKRKMSPMSSETRESFEKSQWKESKVELELLMGSEKFGQLKEIEANLSDSSLVKTDIALRSMGFKNYKGVYVTRPRSNCLVFLRQNKNKFEMCNNIPISYDSMVYDIPSKVYSATIESLRSSQNIPRLDLWLEYSFLLAKDKKLVRLYIDITYQLMINQNFKEFWGISFLRLYEKLLSKFNRFGENEFHVMEIAVQMLTIPTITLKLVKDHQILETLFNSGKNIFLESEALHGFNTSLFYNKINTLINHVSMVINNDVVKYLFLNEKGYEKLKKYFDFLSIFKNIQNLKKKPYDSVIFQENDWYISFFVEKSLYNLSFIFIQKLEKIFSVNKLGRESPQDEIGIKSNLKRIFSNFIKEIYNENCVSPSVFSGVYNFKSSSVCFILPFNRFLTNLIFKFLRIGIVDFEDLKRGVAPGQISFLFEQSLKVLVAASQISSKMWIYNGESLFNQTMMYYTALKKEMMDLDVASLQLGVCFAGPRKFLEIFFRRFEFSEWLERDFSETFFFPSVFGEEEKFVKFCEKTLDLLARIYGDRRFVGNHSKSEWKEHEIIQKLIASPLSFSKIIEQDNEFESNKDTEEILGRIADVSKHTNDHSSIYHLKKEYLKRYDYFFSKNKKENTYETTFFQIPFDILPVFGDINEIFEEVLLFKFLNKVLNLCCFSPKPYSSTVEACLRLIYIAIIESNNKKRPKKVEKSFFSKILGRFDGRFNSEKNIFSSKKTKGTYSALDQNNKNASDPSKTIRLQDWSIFECICRYNKRFKTPLAEFILFSISKRDVAAENVVLEYYGSLSELEKYDDTISLSKPKKNILQPKIAQNTAKQYIEQKLRIFCSKNFITLKTKTEPAKREINCIFCRCEDKKQILFYLTYLYNSNVLLTTSLNQTERLLLSRTDNPPAELSKLRHIEGLNHCGHAMHEKCFFNFAKTVEGFRLYGEYMCPFCQSFENKIRPIFLMNDLPKPKIEWEKDIDLISAIENFKINEIKFNAPTSITDVITLKDSFYSLLSDPELLLQLQKDKDLLMQTIINSSDSDEKIENNTGFVYSVQNLLFFFHFNDLEGKNKENLTPLTANPLRFIAAIVISEFGPYLKNRSVKRESVGTLHSRLKFVLDLCWILSVFQTLSSAVCIANGEKGFLEKQDKESFFPKIAFSEEENFYLPGKIKEIFERNGHFLNGLKVEKKDFSLPLNKSFIVNNSLAFLRKVSLLLLSINLLSPEDFLHCYREDLPIDALLRSLKMKGVSEMAECDQTVSLIERCFRVKGTENGVLSILGNVRPKLVDLPKNFSELFERAHEEKCPRCDKVPQNPALCLLCGELLCAFQNCCSEKSKKGEVTQHMYKQCGDFWAAVLIIKSNSVVFATRKKYVKYPSMYLNAHGEEDEGLRQGLPLVLNKKRMTQITQVIVGGKVMSEIARRRLFSSTFRDGHSAGI